ncbi:hypothetical protein QFW80_04720 [Luteimonas sp. M1R5S18]|uniref:Uncharacterized protein n=1 Tax=Luteimonas rhizosphaericola TaxID=3042024 RepID=A0ABT6JGK8_9GAMM|nr:hypothetical protein [Luteimonas rhizosphaericola]MDH5829820.1 hypothetical protein [Luteimonas rhizosphaericola]
MSPIEKIQEGFFGHIGTAAALVVTGLIGWLALEAAPIVAPAVESALPVRVVLAILALSLIVNVGFAVAIWRLSPKLQALKLKYGILWDSEKNPHCPICKNAGLDYGEWNYGQLGYFCNSCEKVYGLKDSAGKDVKPNDAIAAL